MILNKKNIIPSLMLLTFSLFIFLLPIFGGLTRVNNLLHASLLFFIITIIFHRNEIYDKIIKNNSYIYYKHGLIFISIFLLYFSTSDLWNDPPLSFSSEITHSAYIICFLIIFKIAISYLSRVRIYSILATAIVLLCIFTLIFTDKSQIFISRLDHSFPWAPPNVIDLGGYFAIGIFLLFMIIRDTGNKWLYIPVLLLFFSLLLTQSRNPIFSLIISSLPLLTLIKKSNVCHAAIVIFILILISLVLVFTQYDHNLFSRISKSYNESFIRFGIWQEAFNLFLQKPILGWGFGKELNFINSIGQNIHTTHSLYFSALLKGGIIGMVTFLLMTGYNLKIAIQAFRQGYALECCLFIFSLLFYTTQGMFIIENPNMSWVLFWLPLSIIYSTIEEKQINQNGYN